MHLQRIAIENVRNLKQVTLQPVAGFNILVGKNGSGKTSFLEAIHLLAMGRSFRTHLINRIIHYGEIKLSVFGALTTGSGEVVPLGIEKGNQSENKIRVNGETITSLAKLASLLPLQIINNDSFELINDGPRYRRQYLDWGLFHVQPSFLSVWQDYAFALRQRNAAIRKKLSLAEINTWNEPMARAGETIHAMRETYIRDLTPYFIKILRNLLEIDELQIDYAKGWGDTLSLLEALNESNHHDLQLGYTQRGIHRADLLLRVKGVPVHDALSRGQQKLLVAALKLAQGLLLRELTDKACIYLIDDLPAELDSYRTKLIHTQLSEINAQVFITGVDEQQFQVLMDEYGGGQAAVSCKMFHVKHGEVV